MNSEHPIVKWWRESSEWATTPDSTPEDGMSEGKLAIDAWNAAIEHAVDCIMESSSPLQKIQELKYTPKPRDTSGDFF